MKNAVGHFKVMLPNIPAMSNNKPLYVYATQINKKLTIHEDSTCGTICEINNPQIKPAAIRDYL
ncbi:hypothetical protein [Nostoc sp. UHCC 0251]|uniref:hypothetical protein n=1 Tax=Nostoc sp. UHCC 0251 TaxID=3110240 RepID=UPI002B2016C0|nr:hypothetical protein [Nostoc sp. UHCC 0251]MEA5623218.1 hypothetical protein [Nostoc sp. UHCC 0251]